MALCPQASSRRVRPRPQASVTLSPTTRSAAAAAFVLLFVKFLLDIYQTFGTGRFFEAVGQSSRIFDNGKEGHIRASLTAEIGRSALLLSSPGKIRRTVGGVQMIKTVLYYKIIEENPHLKPATAK